MSYEEQPGWNVDGLEVKARLDFAAKAIDSRGLYKQAGAKFLGIQHLTLADTFRSL